MNAITGGAPSGRALPCSRPLGIGLFALGSRLWALGSRLSAMGWEKENDYENENDFFG